MAIDRCQPCLRRPARTRLYGAALLLFVAACHAPTAHPQWWSDAPSFMVAADHADASAAGAAILARGGNAVDAAVATSLALAVVRPESCGLGGGGFMVIHRIGQPPVALDFRESAPVAAELSCYRDADGRPIAGKTVHGAWAVATPAQVRGLMYALDRFGSGRVMRADVVAPALALSRRPLIVDSHLAGSAREFVAEVEADGRDGGFGPLLSVLAPSGRCVTAGESISRTGMSATLEAIAHDGCDGFYKGRVARAILQPIADGGGPLAQSDFESYSVRELTPLQARYGEFEILTMPPPSSGGAVMIEILNALAPTPGAMPAWNPADVQSVHRLIEAAKHAFADRARSLGDRSPEVLADAERMTARRRADQIRAAFDPAHTRDAAAYGSTAAKDDRGTSHYCVVDAAGNAVAGTDTINGAFGSGLLAPGTGVILNNQMDDFAVDTERPNIYGLRQSERNLIRPGRRPLSSMTPTIVLRAGRVEMVAGASGGPRIISSTLQVLLNQMAAGMPLDRAMAAPRLHHQWMPDQLYLQAGFPEAQMRDLTKLGHRLKSGLSGIAHVQAIARTPNGWRGASDPGKGGRPCGG